MIDVSNITTSRRRTSVAFFTEGTRNLLAAGQRAGIRHHVALSIVGVDRVDFGYYEGKRTQEKLVLGGPAPASVLRATQFYEFPGQLLARSRGPLTLMPQMRVQPVAAREVAAALVALAEGPARGLAPELAGPQEHQMVDLARRVVIAHGLRSRVVGIRIPGAAGRAMTDGGLLPTGTGPRGRLSFEQWLTAGTAPTRSGGRP